MDDEVLDQNLIKIRENLNKNCVQLWTAPYLNMDGSPAEQTLQDLSSKLSLVLEIEDKITYSTLVSLQQRALQKLNERNQFLVTGLGHIKVKVSGDTPVTLNEKLMLTSKTDDLQKIIGDKLNILPCRIKLISKGIVLKKESTLAEQGVKTGNTLMAVILGEDPNELQKVEDQQKALQDTYSDLDVLTNGNSESDDVSFLQVADQSGKNLILPREEKKALVRAMVLHEKGRAALDQKDYPRALVFLLEADNKFNLCHSSLLDAVDNYAVLNLDIAWCFLCLQSVSLLPEGESRLKKCEKNFHKSYGPNLERLLAIKGSTGNENTLFMRLHLLQGVVAYHQGKKDESRAYLERAENELKGLKIDDASLGTLIELGYNESEARFGLRGAYGNLEKALELINKRRDEKKEANQQNKIEKLNQKLGYCADGKQYVRHEYVDTLVQMGYVRSIGVEALRQSNNVMSKAVEMIQEQPELLSGLTPTPNPLSLPPALMEQLSGLGLNTAMVQSTLERNNFDVTKAMEEIYSSINPGTMTNPNFPSTSAISELAQNIPLLKKQGEALQRITLDIKETSSKDYFDLDLNTEETFLIKYKTLLNES